MMFMLITNLYSMKLVRYQFNCRSQISNQKDSFEQKDFRPGTHRFYSKRAANIVIFRRKKTFAKKLFATLPFAEYEGYREFYEHLKTSSRYYGHQLMVLRLYEIFEKKCQYHHQLEGTSDLYLPSNLNPTAHRTFVD